MSNFVTFYLELEKKIFNSQDSLTRDLKLYLINKKISILYDYLGDRELSQSFKDKSDLFFKKLPDHKDKDKASSIDVDKIIFDKF